MTDRGPNSRRLARAYVTRAYIYGLSAVAAGSLAGWLYLFGLRFDFLALGASVVLATVCVVSRRFPVTFGKVTVEVVDVAILTALVLLGPLWAILVAAPSMLYRDRLRTLFVASTQVLAILGAGLAFVPFAEPALFSGVAGGSGGIAGGVEGTGAAMVYAVAAAAVVYYGLECLANVLLLRLKYADPPLQTLWESFLPLLPSDLIAAAAALGTSYALLYFGPVAALILFTGTAAAAISLYLIHTRQKENEDLRAEVAQLKIEASEALDSPLAFAHRVIESLGRKDGRTARLSVASAVYAAGVARELGLDAPEVAKLQTAALLQDAGLISVPDEVLLTPPENLNSVGRLQLEEHTLHGERILTAAPGFGEAARWVRWHHEREDGTGYPDKLRGEWIPLEAKILAVCGAYAALILDGPSSPGLSPQEARRELASLSGKSLDETVVRTFLRLLDAEGENYAAAADHRFAFSVTASGIRPTGTSEGN